jgi:hypothetical protein
MQMMEAWAVDHGVIFNDLPERAWQVYNWAIQLT